MSRTPLRQGDQDGLCGIYAIINALTLVIPKQMTKRAQERLFKTLAMACDAWPFVLWNGTTTDQVKTMLRAAQAEHDFTWGQAFARTKFVTFDDFAAALEDHVSERAVAIISIERPSAHWSVVKDVTPRALLLQDSSGLRTIPIQQCGFKGANTAYEFSPRQTFLLDRKDQSCARSSSRLRSLQASR